MHCCTDEWKIMGITLGPWSGHIKTKMVKRWGEDMQQGMDSGKATRWATEQRGSKRMWVSATAPTSSHNETLFFCPAGHFLLRVFLALQVCNLGDGGSGHS